MYEFYEFFAGGGMARAGLGPRWSCRFANDANRKKAASYAANWGADHLDVRDVAAVTAPDLPGKVDLAWASFPCQDLSLAGVGTGLKGARSGTFWPFWTLMASLDAEGRAPRSIVLENVCGVLSSNEGRDFAAIAGALSEGGYRSGAVVIDAVRFLPQSRPRLFIVAVHKSVPIPTESIGESGDPSWHPTALLKDHEKLSASAQEKWLWWRLPTPPPRNTILADLIDETPNGVTWHTQAATARLLAMMSETNQAKIVAAQKTGTRMVGALYKRTRKKVQRAEIRFDDLSGCLRTPTGGSSRQTIMIVEGKQVKSRLLSSREAARLMGLPDEYRLPSNYNEAYHLVGDGVAVPVVRFIASQILEPVLAFARRPYQLSAKFRIAPKEQVA